MKEDQTTVLTSHIYDKTTYTIQQDTIKICQIEAKVGTAPQIIHLHKHKGLIISAHKHHRCA